jgi:transcriptional regulator with XRE-family HTH domain
MIEYIEFTKWRNKLNIDIGDKIKTLRKNKNMSISELAQKSDVSQGLISQVERDIVTPTIVSLWKIAKSLDVSVGYFFDEEVKPELSPVVNKNERKRIVVSNNNAIYELLSQDLNRKIEFLYITIKVGDSSTEDFVTHEGEECGIVIKGKLLVKMEDREYLLTEGDSIYFDSTIPHRYVNVGDTVCESVWAMTPPSF